jgi:isopenicillin-N epimerase
MANTMTTNPAAAARDLARHWNLDPEVVFLNHGSFGACPKVVLERQAEYRTRMEREPVLFLGRELEPLLDESRDVLARLVDADPDDLSFVPNATTGVNTVLRSLALEPGDEILITDHEYNACRNAAVAIAERAGAQVVVAPVPFPLSGPDAVIEAVMSRVTARTRLLLIDHVTSQTGLIFPVRTLIEQLDQRGIDTLVDGAHAPGMLPLSLRDLRPAYYTGNCHKWLCTPKGSALLYVRRDRQHVVAPVAISHGYNSQRADRSRFRLLFDWGGTTDPSPYLCVPAAIEFLSTLLPGGLAALQQHNHALVCAGRARVLEALGVGAPAPETMLGSLASMPLPGAPRTPPKAPLSLHPLQEALFERHRIEVPIMPWPSPPQWQLRVSAQAYNRIEHYDALARALRELVAVTIA